jgi:hypothetical protein
MLPPAKARLCFEVNQVDAIDLGEDILGFEKAALKRHPAEAPRCRQADSAAVARLRRAPAEVDVR